MSESVAMSEGTPVEEEATEEENESAAAAPAESESCPREDDAMTAQDADDNDDDEQENDPPANTDGAEDPDIAHSQTNGTSTAAPSTSGSAVTTDRKHRLLLEARADRLAWIQKVSLPYANKESDNQWKRNNTALAIVGSSRVAVQAPSVTRVLDMLYGMENESNGQAVSKRIQGILEPLGGSSHENLARAIPSGLQVLETEVAKYDTDSKTGSVLVAYQDLISKLCRPECAMVVQGMRNFCRNVCNEQDEKKLATAMEHYVVATLHAMKSHAAWQKEEDFEPVRRSLESFLYGHVSSHISELLLNDEGSKTAQEEWMERLESLSFVNPHHLELDCFMEESGDQNVPLLLKEPVEALLSVNGYYSPYEKLQRILHVYHGVNAALSEALNKSTSAPSTTNDKVLPSADHVLPTLILLVLRARPKNLIINLRLIEVYCPAQHLRGEAGYAFTNLYGAVQFLRDINLDKGPDSSLDMTAEEFREGLKKCRASAQERLAEQQKPLPATPPTVGESLPLPQDISVREIRAARLAGQDLDLEWALQYHADQRDVNKSHLTDESSVPLVQQAAAMSKSYSFLTTRAEDVKVTDLPLLLKEYRQLVHTTEVLLSERTARLATERKKQLAKKRKKLQANAAAVDPNLM